MTAKELGSWGERYTARRLEQQGWTILAQGYRFGRGEIDLLAADQRYLLVVEVKTRRQGALAPGVLAVTPEKQRQLIRCAQGFLAQAPPRLAALQPRFDVAQLTVELREGEPWAVEFCYYPDAFQAQGSW